MTPTAVLIQQPAIDFTTLIAATHQALGYSIASAADASRRHLSDAERFLSCLAAMQDSRATAGLRPNLLAHVTFSVLVAADERDLLDMLEACSGMPFVVADTLVRGVQVAVVTGSLSQWRDAVKSGCTANAQASVRAGFNKVMAIFEQAGLNVWTDFNKRPLADRTLLLEDKRK
jgi:hypothetical protein